MQRLIYWLGKVKKKGLKQSIAIFIERYIYFHHELLILDRELNIPDTHPYPDNLPPLKPLVTLTKENLSCLNKNFSNYLKPVHDFINDPNKMGKVYLDDDGNAYSMIWLHVNQPFYDQHLYRHTIEIPDNTAYQFAAEIAPDARNHGHAFWLQQLLWNELRDKGFTHIRALVHIKNKTPLRILTRMQFKEIGECIHSYSIFKLFYFSKKELYKHPKLSLHGRPLD